ncbi:CbbBc protein [Lysobacter sp. Root916]|uniref:FdhF/YdeP family oxidoreductase n=1 Tax=Lysobacter sp. Root916 TaxID=1736606 RepID=UPI00070A42FB|nr:FdhF/YdeP family oxidoreductase [Lysobacter sp. Root916]KRD38953.1 CbbBc protein [Lysobacter sp. Root916]
MSDDKPIDHYDKPAGGWDALRSSWQALRDQQVVIKGAGTLLKANQPKGFDCPGCAWPDRNAHSTFEFCENGVKAVANEATSKRVTREFFAAHSVAELADMDDRALEAQGRLTEPMSYDPISDRYVPIAWEQAFARIAGALQGLDSANEAIFYTSGRTSNEAAFLYQLFVREYGTNNLPDCSNMCHEPSGVALTEQLGSGKGSVTLDDFERAEAIFVFGQNPGTNHPRMLGELRSAAKRGCRIVAFNPLRERGLERFADPQSPTEMLSGGSTRIASEYYQPRIGGDLAVATALAKQVVEAGAVDQAFVHTYTRGYDAFADALRATPWPALERESGLSREQLEQAGRIYIDSRATILCWGMGITQHRRSVATIQMLANLLLLRGNIGKPGAGPCPVRGHSNVQGDRTMGIYEQPSARFLDKLGAAFGFAPPREHGYDTLAAIEAMRDGRGKVFFAMGGNFAAATPDTGLVYEALRNCALTVHVSTKLNRSHLVHGREALILPCLGRTEIDLQATGPQAVTVEDSMSMVHLSSGMNPPASPQLLSEPAIVARLAAATLPDSATPWLALVEDYDRIRERIAQVVDGFEDFNRRVRTPGGFHLRHPGREREFPTATGKAQFFVHALADADASAPALLQLMTVRSHDQYNTTVYGLDDRYRGVHGLRRVCFIGREDLEALAYADGDLVDITSVWDDGRGGIEERRVEGFRLVEYDIPRGCLAAYFPETNPLVPLGSHAERARTPASKSIPVRLSRSAVAVAR